MTQALALRGRQRWSRRALLAAGLALGLAAAGCGRAAEEAAAPFTPQVGQAGKDVIWVPTPDSLVTEMLKLAEVKPGETVVDLGSGDGKIAIAAARDFGATARGIEFNPDMVALSQRNAADAGVGDRVQFIQGDIFQIDFRDADVVTMYLLPSLNLKLRPQLLEMTPGTRLVSHAFDMGEWTPDAMAASGGANAYLWIVPARVQGDWRFDLGGGVRLEATLQQAFQQVEASSARRNGRAVGLEDVKLRGAALEFAVPGQPRLTVRGTVADGRFTGEAAGGGGAPRPVTGERLAAPVPPAATP